MFVNKEKALAVAEKLRDNPSALYALWRLIQFQATHDRWPQTTERAVAFGFSSAPGMARLVLYTLRLEGLIEVDEHSGEIRVIDFDQYFHAMPVVEPESKVLRLLSGDDTADIVA